MPAVAEEAVARAAARQLGLPTTIARMNVYYGTYGGLPPWQFEWMLAGMPVPVQPDRASVCNPIYEEDIYNHVGALLAAGSVPATIVVGKEAFLKRAMHIKDCTGFRAGVICQGKDGETKHTDGYCPPDMKLVGGWAEVSKLNWAYPLRLEVSLQEYLGRKNDGTPNRMWSEKPATMIRKVALVQALRESFPDQFGGMYSQEEINKVEDLPTDPIDVSPPPYMEPKVQRERKKASEKPPEPPPPIMRPCPNRDGRMVSVDDCDTCENKEGCPEVGTV